MRPTSTHESGLAAEASSAASGRPPWFKRALVAGALILSGCAGLPPAAMLPLAGPDPRAWRDGGTGEDQFLIYRDLMHSPRRAPVWADRLQGAAADAAPAGLWQLVRELSVRQRDAVFARSAAAIDAPTRDALQALPPALRDAVQAQLDAMVLAQTELVHALRALPPGLTRDELLRPGTDWTALARWAPQVDLPTLGHAMQRVIDATAQLRLRLQQLADADALPKMVWRHRTRQGWIHLDTTGASQTLAPEDVWLWVKVGGDDEYQLDAFQGTASASQPSVRVLLDTAGNDSYRSSRDGADAASGVLGLGVLWDGGGSDHWTCTRWCQAAALLGAAALINEGTGEDVLAAQTQAQAHAVGGLAMLAGNAGIASAKPVATTAYLALSDAQGSAGPSGVALLVDARGDDRYELAAQPLVAPSSQLPGRNRSMGQGAGRGWRLLASDEQARADKNTVAETAGGVGMLIDLQGNDHYVAQVFAQGAGYQEGLGMLIDGGGRNRHEAAWYALGAAAHGAVGVFVASGRGDDDYRISHVTSLGAGHDFSVGWFEDRGGDDAYALGDFGLGLSSDRGTGVFIDAQGCNRVRVQASPPRGMGRRYALSASPAASQEAGLPLREGVAVFRILRTGEHCGSAR